jgi:hypothetical protein
MTNFDFRQPPPWFDERLKRGQSDLDRFAKNITTIAELLDLAPSLPIADETGPAAPRPATHKPTPASAGELAAAPADRADRGAPPARTVPKRRRRPSIATLVRRAEKTGRSVASITTPDGTTIHFGESTPTDATNPWLTDLKATKQ